MAIPATLAKNLRLPVIAAPMFLVSGPELVIATARSGAIGTFPVLNARTLEQVEGWYQQIHAALDDDPRAAAWGINLIVHKTNQQRLQADLDLAVKYKVPLIITSIGNPAPIVEAARTYGGVVFHDVTTLRHARKAAEAGVDGLILVCGGAGGHAGTLNPFAFLPEVRAVFDRTIVLAGALSSGRAIKAAQVLGADLTYMGTRFIATQESMAQPEFKQMILQSSAADIVYTPAVSGIPASFLGQSLAAAGFDAERLKHRPEIDLGKELDQSESKAWRDIWSAGQGVGSITDVPTTAELIARMQAEYDAA